MDSIGNQLRVDGFRTLCDIDGKLVETAAGSFKALVNPQSGIDPALVLGPDLRENDRLHTLKEWVPAGLLANDADSQIDATIDGEAVKITKRQKNVGTPFVEFEIVKVV